MLKRGTVLIEDAEGREVVRYLVRGALWIEVTQDLLAAGLTDEEIAELFRERYVWQEEARLMVLPGKHEVRL
jgi:hypothetical protein